MDPEDEDNGWTPARATDALARWVETARNAVSGDRLPHGYRLADLAQIATDLRDWEDRRDRSIELHRQAASRAAELQHAAEALVKAVAAAQRKQRRGWGLAASSAFDRLKEVTEVARAARKLVEDDEPDADGIEGVDWLPSR